MKKENLSFVVVAIFLVVLGFLVYGNNPSNNNPEPTPSSQGKIDINAVCEGALAYMSFPDGESAATFVAECKEGKHPQVIEEFKTQMNLGDGANI